MAIFDELCSAGNEADALLDRGQYREALDAYAAIIQRSQAANVLDSFVLAKVTLSILLTRVRAGDPQGAHGLWTAPQETLIGQGVHFIETAQTSVEDLMLYGLISAHLHSMGVDREAALSGLENSIQRVARYARDEAPHLLPTVIGNWRANLEEIFECPLAQVPTEAARAHIAFARAAGPMPIPAGLTFPSPSPWAITWGPHATAAPSVVAPVPPPMPGFPAPPEPAPKAAEPEQSIESQMDRINDLMKERAFDQALALAREVKHDLISQAPCDPSLLGWVLFFEFKCLYTLKDYEGAWAQAHEELPCPFVLTSNNAGFRASVCTELAVRCRKPVEDVLAYAKMSFDERSQGGNPTYVLQTLQTTCNLLELRDEEDQAEFYARKMVDIGIEHGADVPVLKGFLMLMRGALRAGRRQDLRDLVDELLGALRPIDKSDKRASLMGDVAMLVSMPSLLANRTKLERFLAD